MIKIENNNITNMLSETTPVEGMDFFPIDKNIFIGNQKSSTDLVVLQNYDITHIINCASTDCPSLHSSINYYNIPISDDMASSITPYLSDTCKFIKNSIENGRKVLVHCEEGRSRSASIIIAYLIFEKGINYRQAFNILSDICPKIQPNPTFKTELINFHTQKTIESVSINHLSLKDLFKPSYWIDWEVYRHIRDDEGVEVGYNQDGRWGNSGAGVLITFSQSSIPEFLLFKRSDQVEEAGKWSLPGGAIKVREDGTITNPLNTAVQELREEAGLPRGNLCSLPIVYSKGKYSYYTYVLDLLYSKDCYQPRLNWENSDYKWFNKEEVFSSPSVHEGVIFAIDSLFKQQFDFEKKIPQ